VKIGEIRSICPYYLTRLRTNLSDIVVMPYNYILDKSMRSMLNLTFKDAIVVFDEAHNIESVCEEMTCFELTINDLFV
jgi:regulator of telomere elongation helicase 1